ncbi:hypothetical protein [Flammeovirga sp. EKP202]|uniref:hypothetical protein n=1 Tax=Flammeovirga sp. EKP202 TaxID=2770592 RepID=UPI00165EC385|nr:hypothetical protein [Flammeovirga sp. EKP202]MBD0400728.1 hypothetical protein [Flammeovirga sp. EKP202]
MNKHTIILFFFLFISFNSHAQQKLLDFYFEGGRCQMNEKIVEVINDGINISARQVVLHYKKSEESMTLNFVDENLRSYEERIEELEGYTVKGKTQLVWRNKKNKNLEIVVIEKAGSLTFMWNGAMYKTN